MSHVRTDNLPSNVSIVSVSHEEFIRLMAGAKAVVLPFRAGLLQAGGQQTFLNAMSMGKVVIAADDSTAEDYITNGVDGIVLSPGDVSSLTEAIASVIENHEYRRQLGENAKKRALDFTEDRFVKGVLREIEQLSGC
jgi:glycosyltransferase involved in cell wall biosynthesis